MLVTTDYELVKVQPPALPNAMPEYSQAYQNQLNNILRLYFNRLTSLLGQLMTSGTGTIPVSIGGTNVDAFGRVRASQPYTLFDSQNRYAADTQFSTTITGTGNTTFQNDQSVLDLTVSSSGTGSVTRQTYRKFPYQPGKGLLVLATFAMTTPVASLVQQVGYFNSQNGVFFRANGTSIQFVLRSYGTGSVVNTSVNQADWNGDPLNGTGASGLTLDVTKAQILWMDFEWLGVGSVRCGFIINGQDIGCHTFNNANIISTTYMTTAILPITYAIDSTTVARNATLKQICSTVISEGGYEQYSRGYIARRTSILTGITTTVVPLGTVALEDGTTTGVNMTGAVVLPSRVQVFPVANQNYEIALIQGATLTGATYSNLNNAQGTGTVAGTTLTISAMTSGAFAAGQRIFATGFGDRFIKKQLSGTTGGAGTYELSSSGTLGAPTTVIAIGNIMFDTAATALTGGTIVQTEYTTASGSGGSIPIIDQTGYNWAYDLNNGPLTVAIRTVSGAPTGEALGSIELFDLTGN